jgi:hypothetical protein
MRAKADDSVQRSLSTAALAEGGVPSFEAGQVPRAAAIRRMR